ncbi:MAG TPA: TolC family protein [bacterium]|nr:TolC family protein [bacterium]HPR86687.1 TolC family protein [bacterium]
MNKFTILMVTLLLGIGGALAQESASADLSLQECIAIALENNSTLRVAQKNLDIAGANVTTATAAWLPQISSSFSTGKYIQGARVDKTDVPSGIDPETGRVIYKQQSIYQAQTERNSHSARVSLSQNLFDFGQTLNSIKAAKADKQASAQHVENTRQSVIFNVKSAYYELLKAIHLEQVYQDAAKLAEDEVNRAQTMMDIGISSQSEVFQAKVTLGSARTTLITQQNAIEAAKANLNNALGRNPSTLVGVREDKSQPIFPTISFDEAAQTAIKNNAALKVYEFQTKASLFSLRMAQMRYMPSIGGSVSYARSNEDIGRVFSSKLDEDFSATLGLGVDLNIFNGLSDKANVQRAKLNHQIDQENLAEQKRLLTAQVQQYFLQLEAYKDFIEINQQNIEAARENLRLQQEKRRVGSGTELEVTQAQVELTRSLANLVNAEYEAKIARAQLETAMGIAEVIQ